MSWKQRKSASWQNEGFYLYPLFILKNETIAQQRTLLSGCYMNFK